MENLRVYRFSNSGSYRVLQLKMIHVRCTNGLDLIWSSDFTKLQKAEEYLKASQRP